MWRVFQHAQMLDVVHVSVLRVVEQGPRLRMLFVAGGLTPVKCILQVSSANGEVSPAGCELPRVMCVPLCTVCIFFLFLQGVCSRRHVCVLPAAWQPHAPTHGCV